jgi:hypothetical protein
MNVRQNGYGIAKAFAQLKPPKSLSIKDILRFVHINRLDGNAERRRHLEQVGVSPKSVPIVILGYRLCSRLFIRYPVIVNFGLMFYVLIRVIERKGVRK